VVLRDLVVTLADGGDCLADLGVLRDQLDLFGDEGHADRAFYGVYCMNRGSCALGWEGWAESAE